jgi:three-Cys-motif partner protein
VLVEKKESSFRKLLDLQPRYPDVEIKPVHGDFRAKIDEILNEIPVNAFAFVLLDPKGWRIPIATIEPLLRRPNTEVVFNFMFEFINRAASMSAADIVQGIDELLPAQGWRETLAAVDTQNSERERPKMRRQILIDTLPQGAGRSSGYDFVAETPVMRPLRTACSTRWFMRPDPLRE